MFLVRRVFKVKQGTSRYEEAGQRSRSTVYYSGGTVPGPANTVYMDWIEDELRSPYREDNKIPEEVSALGSQLREIQEESYIEFYELYSPR